MKNIYYLTIKDSKDIKGYLEILRTYTQFENEHNFNGVCGAYKTGDILYIHDRIFMPEACLPSQFFVTFKDYIFKPLDDANAENFIGTI